MGVMHVAGEIPEVVVTTPQYLIQVSILTPVEGRADERETVVYEQRIEGLELSKLVVWLNT